MVVLPSLVHPSCLFFQKLARLVFPDPLKIGVLGVAARFFQIRNAAVHVQPQLQGCFRIHCSVLLYRKYLIYRSDRPLSIYCCFRCVGRVFWIILFWIIVFCTLGASLLHHIDQGGVTPDTERYRTDTKKTLDSAFFEINWRFTNRTDGVGGSSHRQLIQKKGPADECHPSVQSGVLGFCQWESSAPAREDAIA
jgi:hypothetical protein